MSREPIKKVEGPSDPPREPPSMAEVVERLDRLWADEKPVGASSLPAPVGHRVGKYALREALGRGAFGVVYRARDLELGRDVALKVPRPEVLVDAERLSRFQAEATTAAALDHPGIVQVYEASFTGPTPYIATAYCDGPDLGRWLDAQRSPVAVEQAVAFLVELLSAVKYAHRNGVLHRDLKPSNVLLARRDGSAPDDPLTDFQPRLTDFGLAKLVEAGLQDTRSSLLIGTPLYMAPEQLGRGEEAIGPAVDVFALGVVLFELLTLRTPFEGEHYVEVLDRLRTGERLQLEQARPGLPQDVQTIVSKCLEKEPADRYPSAKALQDDLQRCLDGRPIAARPLKRWGRFLRWCRKPQTLFFAGAYGFAWHLVVTVWMCTVLVLGLRVEAFPGEALPKTLFDMVFVTGTCHGPIMLLGFLLARRRLWAYWPSAGCSVLFLAIVVYSGFKPSVLFQYNYPTPISKINTYAFLFYGALLGVGTHLMAYPAWRKLRQTSAVA